MLPSHTVRRSEIGDRERHAQQARDAASGEVMESGGLLDRRSRRRVEAAATQQGSATEVAGQATLARTPPSVDHGRPDRSRPLFDRTRQKPRRVGASDAERHVDPVSMSGPPTRPT